MSRPCDCQNSTLSGHHHIRLFNVWVLEQFKNGSTIRHQNMWHHDMWHHGKWHHIMWHCNMWQHNMWQHDMWHHDIWHHNMWHRNQSVAIKDNKWNRPQFEKEIWPHWQWLSPLGSEKGQNLSSSTAFGPWVPPWDDNDGPPHHTVIILPSDHHKQQKGQKSVEFNSFGTLGSSIVVILVHCSRI